MVFHHFVLALVACLQKDRPVDGETRERLTPAQVARKQGMKYLRGPCCLCVLLDEKTEFVEAVVFEHPEQGYIVRVWWEVIDDLMQI
jgi:hypothetical protein